MLKILSNLVFLLTLSPFSEQSGLWKNPGIGFASKDESGELPNSPSRDENDDTKSIKELQKQEQGQEHSLSSPRHLEGLRKLAGNDPLNFERGREWTEFLQGQTSAGHNLRLSFIGALISKIALMNSENQTIVFLLGYSLVIYLVAVFLSIGELIAGKDDYASVPNLTQFGSALLGTAIVAKIYYFLYPPQLQLLQLSTTATGSTSSSPNLLKPGVGLVKFPTIK